MKKLIFILLTTPSGLAADYVNQTNSDGTVEQVLVEDQGTYIVIKDQNGTTTMIDKTGQ